MTEQITAEQRIVILQDVIPTMMEWYRRTARDLPWRERPEAYRVWISEIMLQQTRIEAVKPYYDRFLKKFPGVRELAEAPEEQVLKCGPETCKRQLSSVWRIMAVSFQPPMRS